MRNESERKESCRENPTETGVIELLLPYPPSVNHYYCQGKRGRRYVSADGQRFNYSVIAEVLRNRAAMGWTCRLAIEIELWPKDNRRRDYDNPLKALNDSLMKAGVFRDDRQIRKAKITLNDPDKSRFSDGACRVILYPL